MSDPTMQEVPEGSFFRVLVQKLSVPWLAAINGYKTTYSAIGVPLDAQAEYLRLGVLQRFPGIAQSEALPFIGADRKIIRGFRESDEAYAPRLIHAFPTWRLAGNAQTLLTELAAYFSPNAPVIRYVVNGVDQNGDAFADWWTIDGGVISHTRASPSNWDWDGQTGQIRFWIIIYRNEGFTPWFWGDGHYWGGGQSWGYEENFVDNFAVDARNMIAQWKAGGSHAARFGGIIVTDNLTLFDPAGSGAGYPDGTWEDYFQRVGIPTTFYLGGV